MSWQDTPVVRNEPVVTFSQDISTPMPIDDAIVAFGSNASKVSRDDALSVPAVLRGRNLLCSIATLPLETRNQKFEKVDAPFLDQISATVPNVVTLADTVEDLVFEGIAWWRITQRTAIGKPGYAEHVSARLVTPPQNNERTVDIDGERVPLASMIRFDSPNPALLEFAGRAIKRALTFEKSAARYADDPRANDYFTPAEGADPVDDEEVEELLNDWQQARRRRSTAYVPAALKYQTVEQLTPAELQLVDLQKQVYIEIANGLGIDPEELGVSTTSRTYANAVDRRRDRVNDTLAPYMRAITDRLSMNDITTRGHQVRFDLDDYLKADAKTRWETHAIGLTNGVISVEEVREKEDLPAIPVERRPRPTTEETPVSASLKFAAFAADKHAEVSFDMDEPTAAFRVNREKRTISGLIIPWDKVGISGGMKWRFAKDALHWTDESRVKLNNHHDRKQAVAVATRLQSTPAGLDGSFRVARGEEGDRVLSLAEDGVLDGFSVEVAVVDGDKADFGEDGVLQVARASLRGVAITAFPAFDDARVTSVAATREVEPMPEVAEEKNEVPATGPDTASFAAALEAQNVTFTSAVDALTDVAKKIAEAAEKPMVIESNHQTANFNVNEEAPYRFDGARGKHDFSTDIIAGAKGDYDAMKRAEKFLSANFAVTSANVASLNPERNRPDLYVDQLQYNTPIWNSISKGTIPDNTPFVLPKFNDSSGLVADHVEGTEPTPGAMTATSQTITPSPVSGKVEVTREAWDQGGSPQLSTILWQQMTRRYNEALEEAAAAMLNALTLTEITLTADSKDAVLASEVKRALANLHFIRGGMRFQDFKLARNLYTNLADAKDADGRPLFPILGAQNTDGTTGALFGSINIAGLAGMPSWALPVAVTGTPNVPSKSYLYNREDVHGWASPPQRLNFEYRVAFVDVAIWGYKATAATRNEGIRRVNYYSA